jgi:hypothetical protein
MTPSDPIEVYLGESIDIDVACTDDAGAALDVSGAQVTFEVVQLATGTRVPSGAQVFRRRNAAAGGDGTEVVQPKPSGGADTFRVKVIPANTATRGRFRYRTTVAWPAAAPPVARIWEGEFSIL